MNEMLILTDAPSVTLPYGFARRNGVLLRVGTRALRAPACVLPAI